MSLKRQLFCGVGSYIAVSVIAIDFYVNHLPRSHGQCPAATVHRNVQHRHTLLLGRFALHVASSIIAGTAPLITIFL